MLERRPGKRKGSPDDLWRVAEAPFPTVEGYRITWVHSYHSSFGVLEA